MTADSIAVQGPFLLTQAQLRMAIIAIHAQQFEREALISVNDALDLLQLLPVGPWLRSK